MTCRILGRLAIGAVLLFTSGCATQAELRRVRQDEKEIRGLLADTQVSVENLRRRVDTLRGDIESGGGGGRAATLPQLEREVAALKARVALLEQGAPTPTATPLAPPPVAEGAAATPALPEAHAESSAAQQEEAALASAPVDDNYRQAFQLMQRGECNQAIPLFREFLRRNPKSDYADNAQYWIGECYYNLKDYNQSILALNDVLTKYPKSEKVPAALLRQASAFADLGYKVDAHLILQKLISEHPGTEEATRARQQLQALGE